MSQHQVFDLQPKKSDEARSDGVPSVPTVLKLLLLLALKDRADELWLMTRGGQAELWYRVDGSFHKLVAPPDDMVLAMRELVRDLSRPRGWRAWVVGILRWVIWTLDPSPDPVHSGFFVSLGEDGVLVSVDHAPGGEDNLVVRMKPMEDLSPQADEVLKAVLEKCGSS